MQHSAEVIGQLEHDHLIVERMVDDLREGVQSVLRGEREAVDLKDEFIEFLELAEEELYEHFDREEQVVFPFLAEQLPESQSSIERLSHAHDRMCGAMSRMQRLVELDDDEFSAQFDALVALFARFDANFGRHSREEIGLFQALGQRLQPADLERLQQMLREI